MSLIAGVDEAGRGPLAGPVVAAAVILPEKFELSELNDSKKLSAAQRERLFDLIVEQAVAYAIAEASEAEIDDINILWASMLAMKRAVEKLDLTPDRVLVDGNRVPDLSMPAQAIVGGDGIEPCISAASILAKVTRDRLMASHAQTYPHYGFETNQGYPTKAHREAIEKYGVTPIHRRSFGPVKKQLELFAND